MYDEAQCAKKFAKNKEILKDQSVREFLNNKKILNDRYLTEKSGDIQTYQDQGSKEIASPINKKSTRNFESYSG